MDTREFFEKYIQNQHLPGEHEQFVAWFSSISESGADRIMDEFISLVKLSSTLEKVAFNEDLLQRIEGRLDEADRCAAMKRAASLKGEVT